MRIAVPGTGMVGRALAGKLAELSQDVTVGTRDVADTMARTEPDIMGNPRSRRGPQHTRSCGWPISPRPPVTPK